VLTVSKRDGNTLSDVIRNAWDGREYIAAMTKNNKAAVTNAHISIAGHITEDELRLMVDVVSMANGWCNRFLFCCVKRSKYLPFGGNLDASTLNALKEEINAAFMRVYLCEKEIPFDEEAKELWDKGGLYHELTEGRPGLLGTICGRAEAQTRRLAVLYAVLDGSDVVKLVHLRAALALWKYCEDSVRYIFGDNLGEPFADALLQALRNSNGLSRTAIRDLFKRNQSSEKIDSALASLEKYGLARRETQSTGNRGPRAEVWSPTKTN
jgi:hypothetical protein